MGTGEVNAMDWHPIQEGGGGGGSRNTPSCFMLQKAEISWRRSNRPSRLVAELAFTLPVSQLFNVYNPVGLKRTHTLFGKSRTRNSRCCGSVLCGISWLGG